MVLRRAALVVTGTLACAPPVVSPFSLTELAAGTSGGTLVGGVFDSNTGNRLEKALVIVQCTCLAQPQERETDARGMFRFDDLPAGKYGIQAMYGRGSSYRTIEVTADRRAVATIGVDPTRPPPIEIG
jgi:hypothetical protein